MSHPTDGTPVETDQEATAPTAAERLLRTLCDRGVDYIFANFGTDHTPLLEAAARMRTAGEADSIPEVILCPTEFPALSAAHGYAAVTGKPQAVVVHVDVGTQSLGAAIHNAHRAKAPVFIVAGLAPVTHQGYPGSRDSGVHYIQDVFDQPSIVREYCRWVTEYRPPADPVELVDRGLERATGAEPGPVYLSATREALETPVSGETIDGAVRRIQRTGADAEVVSSLAERLRAAEAPLVITSELGAAPNAAAGVDTLVAFAEATGAGVVENRTNVLNFPRDHELHAGFAPGEAFKYADLVVLAATDVPWTPAQDSGSLDAPVIQIDSDPTKRYYPQWPFSVTDSYDADPVKTLAAVAEQFTSEDGGGEPEPWPAVGTAWREAAAESVRNARAEDRITPAVLSDALNDFIDEETLVVNDAVTSNRSVEEYIRLTVPGSYIANGGSGLGFGNGAAVGAKLARPEKRVIATVGDGAHLFSQPTVCAWLSATYDAPVLTVIYDNEGWNAVESATRAQHPEGESVADGVPESRFGSDLDLTKPGAAAGSETHTVTELSELASALQAGVNAVDEGTPAVVSVELERA